jgi:hypothetical protein
MRWPWREPKFYRWWQHSRLRHALHAINLTCVPRLRDARRIYRAQRRDLTVGDWYPSAVGSLTPNPWLPVTCDCGEWGWRAGPKAPLPSPCPGCGRTLDMSWMKP